VVHVLKPASLVGVTKIQNRVTLVQNRFLESEIKGVPSYN
jgi:hypothetical protein